MSLLSQSLSLAKQGARWRTELFGVKVTLGTGTEWLTAAKSPTKNTREQNAQGTGYIQRNMATFLTARTWATRPAIGSQFTIQESLLNPGEVGTEWRIFDLTPGAAGEEDRCVCFRLD